MIKMQQEWLAMIRFSGAAILNNFMTGFTVPVAKMEIIGWPYLPYIKCNICGMSNSTQPMLVKVFFLFNENRILI